MEFFVFKYKLKSMGNWNDDGRVHKAEGALLKILWNDGKFGFADLHPWPTLGDEDLFSQLSKLKKGKLTYQVEQSLWLASRDAEARKKNVNAFGKGVRLKNHFLLMDGCKTAKQSLLDAKELGFTTLKLKVGKDPVSEIRWINEELTAFNFKLRLDFNAQLNYMSVIAFLNGLETQIKSKIEFIEDPCPFKKEAWSELKKHVPLAIDREIRKVDLNESDPPFDFFVYKPAIQELSDSLNYCIKNNLKMVITSNLDHPLGVSHAAWVALETKKKYPNMVVECGLLSMGAYKYDDFASMIKTDGSYFVGTFGNGVGFDFLLDKIEWEKLS